MAVRVLLLVLTFVLMALTASDFSILAGWAAPGEIQFNYYTVSHRSGWGSPYVSEYSLAQVVVYLLGYAAGLSAFVLVVRNGTRAVGSAGVALCALGMFSFTLEASHWLLNHHNSLIASVPVIMLPLCLVAVVQQWRVSRDADTSVTFNSSIQMT